MEFLKTVSLLLFIVYVSLSIVAFASGTLSSKRQCNKTPIRLQKVFPTFEFGCYMSEEVEE